MLRTKKADRIVCLATVVMLLAAVCLWGFVEPVRGDGSHTVGYEGLLFDQSKVHTIDITMANWDDFIANATAEEYTECNIVVDGEKYNNVAIRAKGNTSLSSVATLGSTRYSFKVEFDHYVKGMTYHGLDKLSLNNMIQDATMMKDYLAYTLMGRMDVPSPLCSYVQINVNGEPWGLYLAVEGVEDAFTDRNGMTKGELYKPDSLSFGGGRGNGRDFDFEQFRVKDDEEDSAAEAPAAETTPAPDTSGDTGASFGGSSGMPNGMQMPEGQMPEGQMPEGDFTASSGDSAQTMPQMPENFTLPDSTDSADNADSADGTQRRDAGRRPNGGGFGGFNFGMGSEDVKLIYSDDEIDSYSNIFNNAKTKIKTKDKTRLIESLKKLNAQEDLENVVNQDEVIRYLAVHNFLCNDDSYTGMMVHNYYLYEEKGKLSIIPWDYNLGFGGFSASGDATSTVNSPIDSPVSGGTTDSRPLIAWIFSDEESLAAYHEAYDRFITETVESGWLADEIDRVQAMITPYLEKDESAFYDMDEFAKAVSTLKTFCEKRGQSIRGQLEGDIPSTSDGQRSSSALIDASEISTSDMGSMNSSKGGGGGGGFTMPQGMPQTDGQSGGAPSGDSAPPENGGQFPSDQEGNDGSFGGSAGSSGASASDMPQPEATPEGGDGSSGASASDMPQPGAASESGEATEQPQKRDESKRSREMPAGMNFPGGGQPDQSGQWLQVGLCAALLLAAVLVIRKVSAHNQ